MLRLTPNSLFQEARGRGKRAICIQRVGLHQQAVELDAIQQLAQGRDLAAGIGGVGVLGNGYPKGVGVQAHLGDPTRCARSGLIDRTTQCLAVTHQGIDRLGDARLGATVMAALRNA